MNGEDKKYLEERLTKLETSFQERWRFHDGGAVERSKIYSSKFEDVKDTLKSIMDKIYVLPCATNTEKIDTIEGEVKTVIGNHLFHLNSRITGLYFTVVGSVLLLGLGLIIKYIVGSLLGKA